jgi:GNAT superfamily N-acetyltransferase
MCEMQGPWHKVLEDGRIVTLRWLQPTDGAALFDFFERFPAESKAFFAPHGFDLETCKGVCRQSSDHFHALVADFNGMIVAYFILSLVVHSSDLERMPSLDADTTVSVAPSVSPEFRGTGIAVEMMQRLFERARQAEKKRAVLMGGMSVTNERALAYYYKCGFKMIGEWGSDPLKYDMALDLVGE